MAITYFLGPRSWFSPRVLSKLPGLRFTVSAFTMIKVGFLMIVVADAIWMTPTWFCGHSGIGNED